MIKKKRCCINVDQCIVTPTIIPFIWSIVLFVLFFFKMWVEGSKNINAFWESMTVPWRFWFYLSGPISLAVSIIISIVIIIFPISYFELCDGSDLIRVHRVFKKDQFILIDDIKYIRFDKGYKKNWFLYYAFLFLAPGYYYTIKIHREFPLTSLVFSSSLSSFKNLVAKMKNTINSNEVIENDFYIVKKNWYNQYGSPEKHDWYINLEK